MARTAGAGCMSAKNRAVTTRASWPVVKKAGVSPLFSKDWIEAADKLTETMNKPCEQQ
ncbi:MAG: hypothetical protein WBK26_15760 [Burkholderiaceae bacterium]